MRYIATFCLGLGLMGCALNSPFPQTPAPSRESTPVQSQLKHDSAPANPPAAEVLDKIPDATPQIEPLIHRANKPYTIKGQSYTPMTTLQPYKERGKATWYGTLYHNQKTAIGEIYNMYTMTAAHTILPLPSYARVTNLENGKTIVVRINDRGPFRAGRIIDLSYTAAYKLGILKNGNADVEVELLNPQALPSDDSYYIQLGAFQSESHAQSLQNQLRAYGTVSITHDTFYKVRLGPYATRALAEADKQRIQQEINMLGIVQGSKP